MTPEVRTAAFALIASGQTVAAAAAAVGCTRVALAKALYSSGTTAYGLRDRHRPPPRRPMTEAQRDTAIALVAEGETLHAAGKRVGINGPALSHAIGRAGLSAAVIRQRVGTPARPPRVVKQKLFDSAVEMIASGVSMRSAAKRLGLRQSTLWDALNTRGLTVAVIKAEVAAGTRVAARRPNMTQEQRRRAFVMVAEGMRVRLAAAEVGVATCTLTQAMVVAGLTAADLRSGKWEAEAEVPRVAHDRRCLSCGAAVAQQPYCDFRMCVRCRRFAASSLVSA